MEIQAEEIDFPLRIEKIRKTVLYILKMSDIPDKISSAILSTSSLNEFEKNLRHKSYDPNNNYEEDEFVGDNIVNLIVALYVIEKFDRTGDYNPTVIKHDIQSNKRLGSLAMKYELVDLLLTSEPKAPKIKGDIFEAFIGCLYKITTTVKAESTAFLICKKVIFKMLDRLEVTKCKVWKDPISTFKEKYIDFYFKGTKLEEFLKMEKTMTGDHQVSVLWKKQNSSGLPSSSGKKYLVVKSVHRNQKIAKQNAVLEATRILSKAGIRGKETPTAEEPTAEEL